MTDFRVLAGVDPTLAFENPAEVLRAAPGDPDAALGPAQERLDHGAWIAGYFGYDGAIALGVFERPREFELPHHGAASHSPLLSSVDRDEYDGAIGELQRSIYEGDVYQVNYTVPFAFETHGDPLALYARYAHRTGAKYQAFVEDGARAILSWSPELFLAIDGTRVETKPMKGTAALDRVEELQDDKNRAEHLMIVDLLRNDLHRICDRVRVEALFVVERYPTFATMTSTISGELRDGVSLGQIVRAAFPCGSVTGAPKRAAMHAIARTERRSRGVYCGSIGFLSPQRRGWWNVAIRTAQIDVESGIGRFDAGGGIVADSNATDEWDEIRLKSRFLDPGDFAILETFASDADDAALGAHLARMRATARAFGIDFDGAGLIDALGARASHHAGDGRAHLIRVRLHAEGRFEILDEELEPLAQPVRIRLAEARVRSDDPFLQHKTTWRPAQDAAKEEARRSDCFEALLANERGELTEGWRTNLFVERNGVTWTPPVASGLLPGILRSRLVSEGRVRERAIAAEELRTADAIYVGNSARGLLRASLIT
jgi:para-aminobenzoate synthetase/4-amino-4-deoxychorismate lyase